jgi:hypothetical protein
MVSPAATAARGLIPAVSAALVVLAVVASDGFYNIDEVIYFMGAEAFRETGSFVVENGHAALPLDALRLWFLVEGPKGLVPQYPVGPTVAGALLLDVFGQRALIALNVAAGIGTLVLTHALALRLFGCARVALLATGMLVFGTFWAEYVVGHWPHSVSVFCIALAVWLFLDTLDRTTGAWKPAALSGLAVGAGLLFRLEGVILLPGLVAAAIIHAARPLPVLVGGAAGVLPFAGLLAWSNAVRFGTWNPLSYGSSGGATDPANYLPLFLALPCALAVLVGLRLWGRTRSGIRGRSLALAAIAICGALWLSPLGPLLGKLAAGAHALLLDFTVIEDRRVSFVAQPDGTVLSAGLPKKALGQSLPWLGCLVLLAVSFPGERRRSVGVVLILSAAWILPFALHSWHGGLGSNMRYFLPLLPMLCALVAFVLLQLADRHEGGLRLVLRGGIAGILIAASWLVLAPDRAAQLHQFGALAVLLAITLVSLVAGISRARAPTGAALVAAGAGLGLAMALAADDFADTQAKRLLVEERSAGAQNVAGRAVFLGPPEFFAQAVGNPEHLLAVPDRLTLRADPALVAAICAAGYRLILPERSGSVAGRRQPLEGAAGLAEFECDRLEGARARRS